MSEEPTRPDGVAARDRSEVGRYKIERELGEGGMGRVFLAVDRELGRRVALKLLQDRDDRARLVREARAMARLSHPNVVAIYDVGRDGDRDYVAMELVDGDTLARWLTGERSTRAILDAFVAAGRGLAAAHDAGIVHRDFKPDNVLRAKDGRVLVTDFGLARERETRAVTGATPLPPLTRAGEAPGTPPYMPPEQWDGGAVSPATDQFAFCVALWEALAGARPFAGASEDELRAAIEAGPEHGARLPRGLRRILARGLEPRPSRRWPSMRALLAAIARTRRRPVVAAGVAGAVALAAGAYAIASMHGSPACMRRTPPDLTGTAPEVAAVLQREFGRWQQARDVVCTGDPPPVELACLDGVLDHLASLRTVKPGSVDTMFDWLVDPARCTSMKPPHVATGEFPEVAIAIDALAAWRTSGGASLALREPCARAIAALAEARGSLDGHTRFTQYNEASDAAIACGDDRLTAAVENAIASAALDHKIDVSADRALARAAAAVERVPQPDVMAANETVRAREHEQIDEIDDAVRELEPALGELAVRGREHARLVAVTQLVSYLLERARPDDLAEIRRIAASERGAAADMVARLDIADGFARQLLGDVPGGHAEILRAWNTLPHEVPDDAIVIAGTVVDPDGAPVANATVAAASFLTFDAIGIVPNGEIDPVIGTTDATGHYALRVSHGALVIASKDKLRSRPMPADTGTLHLEPTHDITGKVALGSIPASSAFVTARLPDDYAARYRILVQLARDGSYTISGMPPTAMTLAASDNNTRPLRGAPSVTVDPTTTHVDLPLEGVGRYHVAVVVHRASPEFVAYVAFVRRRRQTLVDISNLGSESFRAVDSPHAIPAPDDVKALTRKGDIGALFDVDADDLSACAILLFEPPRDPALRDSFNSTDVHLAARCVPVLSPVVEISPIAQKWPD